mgnify:CR=1 FL=1
MFKVVKMRGGLGNQMFIYAFYLSLKKKYPLSIINLDILDSWFAHSGYDIFQVFQLKNKKSYKFYRRQLKFYSVFNTKYFFKNIEEHHNDYYFFNSKYLQTNFLFSIYDGFWQSEKYFKSIESEIKNIFKFNLDKLN